MLIIVCIIELCILLLFVLFFFIYRKNGEKQNNILQEELEKTRLYYKMLNIWFSQEQIGKKLIPYMKKKGYNHVAIYGMAELGERLYSELLFGGIEVTCIIDKSPYVLGEFKLAKPTDSIINTDVIIVTAEYYFDSIQSELRKNTDTKIISLSTLIGNAFMMNW